MVTITIPTAISGISRAQNKRFYRSTRLTPPINLIDTGHPRPANAAALLKQELAATSAAGALDADSNGSDATAE
jgi:hypothetical protein